MKQRIRLKGRLKAYLEAALVLGAVLAGVNIGIYFLDIGAGVIVSAFLVVYFIVMLILLYYNKPIIMNEFISFATQYGQIQRKLLRWMRMAGLSGPILLLNRSYIRKRDTVSLSRRFSQVLRRTS